MVAIIIVAVALVAIVLMLVFSDQAVKKRQLKEEWKKEHFRLDNLAKSCEEAINDVLNMDVKDLNLNRTEMAKREKQQARLRKATRESCLGDAGDRDFLKDYIKDIMTKALGVDEATVNQIVPFANPDAMSPVEKFEHMYVLFRKQNPFKVFGQMIETFNWTQPKPTSDGRAIYMITEEDIENAYDECELIDSNYDSRLDVVVQRVYETLYGHDVADTLVMDDTLDGISAGVGGRTRVEYNYMEELLGGDESRAQASRSYDIIYCVYHGMTIRLKFLSFRNEATLMRVVKNICRNDIRKPLSKKNPLLHGTMKNNSRIVVARPPVSDSWVFYMRKFGSADAKHIESLVTHSNRGIVIALLKAVISGELNGVISGGMGSGKTTLLKALVGYMNPLYTIRVAETSFELNLNNLYPERDIHCMQERGEVTIYDILTFSKKSDADIFIVGEVNEPKIAGAYVQVAQSGSRMAITTLHHNTTEELIEYLRNALVEEFGINDVNIAEKQIVDILNFDVHTEKDLEGNFFIRRINEVVPAENKDYPTNLSEAQREFYKRSTDRHAYTVNTIIEFNHDKMCYEVKRNLSQHTLDIIRKKAGEGLAEGISQALEESMRGVNYDAEFITPEEADRNTGYSDGGDYDSYGDEYRDEYSMNPDELAKFFGTSPEQDSNS